MAFQAYVSIKGNKQGQFKGEAVQTGRQDKWIPVSSFTMGVKSPRDIATGQPSGKRQYAPITIVKEWGAASPQGLASGAANEILSEVVIEFTKTTPQGEEYIYQTVTLTDATIDEIQRFAGGPTAEAEAAAALRPVGTNVGKANTLELERWSFTFRKIEVEDKDGKTMFLDNWT